MKQVAPNIWQHTLDGVVQYYRGDHGNFEGPYDSMESALGTVVQLSATVKPVERVEHEEDQDNQRGEETEE